MPLVTFERMTFTFLILLSDHTLIVTSPHLIVTFDLKI